MSDQDRTIKDHEDALLEFYAHLPENLEQAFRVALGFWRQGKLAAEIYGSTVTFTGEGASVRFGIVEPAP